MPAYGFIELFVVAAFVVAWFILELVCKRLDKARDAAAERADARTDDTERSESSVGKRE